MGEHARPKDTFLTVPPGDYRLPSAGTTNPCHLYKSHVGCRLLQCLLLSVPKGLKSSTYNARSTLLTTSTGHRTSVLSLSVVCVPPQVNAADKDGLTVLHLTAKQGLHTVFRFLLSHGADRDKRTTEGLTVEQLATPSVQKVLQGK